MSSLALNACSRTEIYKYLREPVTYIFRTDARDMLLRIFDRLLLRSHDSAAAEIHSSVFWIIMPRNVVSNRRFETTYRS
jgi:hypothetical protein